MVRVVNLKTLQMEEWAGSFKIILELIYLLNGIFKTNALKKKSAIFVTIVVDIYKS